MVNPIIFKEKAPFKLFFSLINALASASFAFKKPCGFFFPSSGEPICEKQN